MEKVFRTGNGVKSNSTVRVTVFVFLVLFHPGCSCFILILGAAKSGESRVMTSSTNSVLLGVFFPLR